MISRLVGGNPGITVRNVDTIPLDIEECMQKGDRYRDKNLEILLTEP